MTLVETTFWTKILSKYAVIILFFIILGYFGYMFFNPQQGLAVLVADYKCGRISQPQIVPQADIDISKALIQVKALKSSLPDSKVPPIGYVYKIDIKGENFETRNRAQLLATNFDFDPEEIFHDPGSTKYEWRNSKLKATLTYDTATDNFAFFKNLSVLPKAPNYGLPTTTFKAPEFARNYLTALGVYTSEFQNGKAYALPVVLRDGRSFIAKSIDEAQLFRVDLQKVTPLLVYPKARLSPLYQGDKTAPFTQYANVVADLNPNELGAYEITYGRRVGQSPEIANVQVYISEQMGKPSAGVFQLFFNNWRVEKVPCGTYPLRLPSNAITIIGEGGGTVVSLLENGDDPLNPSTKTAVKEINLYQMELAYYESNSVQPYLQPIYIATGEAIFTTGAKGKISIYVPAINYEVFTTK